MILFMYSHDMSSYKCLLALSTLCCGVISCEIAREEKANLRRGVSLQPAWILLKISCSLYTHCTVIRCSSLPSMSEKHFMVWQGLPVYPHDLTPLLEFIVA
jgi:hypothetical protein